MYKHKKEGVRGAFRACGCDVACVVSACRIIQLLAGLAILGYFLCLRYRNYCLFSQIRLDTDCWSPQSGANCWKVENPSYRADFCRNLFYHAFGYSAVRLSVYVVVCSCCLSVAADVFVVLGLELYFSCLEKTATPQPPFKSLKDRKSSLPVRTAWSATQGALLMLLSNP